MGEAYGAYTSAINDPLYTDLSSRLVGVQPVFSPSVADAQASSVADAQASSAVTFSVLLTGQVGNLGKLPATNALVRSEILAEGDNLVLFRDQASQTILARYDGVLVPSPFTASLVISGRHTLRLSLDPEGWIDEPRGWNNVATTTLDMRPDLAIDGMMYRLDAQYGPSATVLLTVPIANQGYWPSSATGVSATLETWPERMAVATQSLSLSSLPISASTHLTTQFVWAPPDHDLYHLAVEVDVENDIPEPDVDNNKSEQLLPMALSATLQPLAALVITSASGAVQLFFPPGAVSTPTEILYTPLWPAELETGLIHTSTVAFSLLIAGDGMSEPVVFGRPVTVTWHYGDQALTLDEAQLRLFGRQESGVWYDAACQPYVHETDLDRLSGSLCQTGQFVFGNRYDRYLPLISLADVPVRTTQEPKLPTQDNPGSRSPLRLP